MEVPQVVAIAHSSDFSLVSAGKPAVPGEYLSIFATGLGPTKQSMAPGTAFPANPRAPVNSPIQVTVNGQAAAVSAAVGYPGATDGYQVNFLMPAVTQSANAAVQLSAAWIPAGVVTIPVQ
jgi:uncharacterized protein (TIGR03437 family)